MQIKIGSFNLARVEPYLFLASIRKGDTKPGICELIDSYCTGIVCVLAILEMICQFACNSSILSIK